MHSQNTLIEVLHCKYKLIFLLLPLNCKLLEVQTEFYSFLHPQDLTLLDTQQLVKAHTHLVTLCSYISTLEFPHLKYFPPVKWR